MFKEYVKYVRNREIIKGSICLLKYKNYECGTISEISIKNIATYVITNLSQCKHDCVVQSVKDVIS